MRVEVVKCDCTNNAARAIEAVDRLGIVLIDESLLPCANPRSKARFSSSPKRGKRQARGFLAKILSSTCSTLGLSRGWGTHQANSFSHERSDLGTNPAAACEHLRR
jgi:hypothetical protein